LRSALVLGASLGSSVLAILNTLHSPPGARDARQLPVQVHRLRSGGAIDDAYRAAAGGLGDEARRVVVLPVLQHGNRPVFLFLTKPIARVRTAIASRPDGENPSKPRHLDASALDTPSLAMSVRRARRCASVT
jgi:phosphate:Na+ symporter